MEFGFFAAHEQHAPRTLIGHASAAEEAGFDTVWTSDHFHPWWHTDAHCGAAWPWLGAALERTGEATFATGVTPPIGRYHPGLIAQVFATLDSMYPGRVRLTLATGEAMNERPLGYEWPEYEERRERLVEACEIIQRLWEGGFHDYDGDHWQLDTARLYTLPDTREPTPMFIAGNGPKTAKVAGRYADGFLTLVDPETYEETLVPALEAGAAEAGRDPDDITRIRQLTVSYGDDYEEALDAIGFWRGAAALGFEQDEYDPREVEEAGRELSRGEAEKLGLVTTDIQEILDTVERHRAAGFDGLSFLSSSPSQQAFIDAMGENVL